MPDFALNCRETLGAATDGANQYPMLADTVGLTCTEYPTDGGGVDYGCTDFALTFPRGRDRGGTDPELEGMIFVPNDGSTQRTIQIDIPNGTYIFTLALGDWSGARPEQYCQISDAGGVLFTIHDTGGTDAQEYVAIDGSVTTTPLAVQSAETAVTGPITIVIGTPSTGTDNSCLAHFGMEEVVGGGGSLPLFVHHLKQQRIL